MTTGRVRDLSLCFSNFFLVGQTLCVGIISMDTPRIDFFKSGATYFRSFVTLLAVGCDDALRAVRLPRSSSFRVLLFAWIQSIEGLTF